MYPRDEYSIVEMENREVETQQKLGNYIGKTKG